MPSGDEMPALRLIKDYSLKLDAARHITGFKERCSFA